MGNKRAEASELNTRLILAGLTVIAMIVLGASKESAVRGAGMRPAFRERQVVTRVDPVYPAGLRESKSGEVVRLEVLVGPDGEVKSAKVLGGSPALAESSLQAIQQWKYVPAETEQKLLVKINFDPYR
jgi:TonB family protein